MWHGSKLYNLFNELALKKEKMVLNKNAKICSEYGVALFTKNMRRV